MLELISVAAFSHSKSIEKTNEDAILLPLRKGNGYVFAIADGVGSYQGANYASKLAIEFFARIHKIPEQDSVEKVLLELKDKLHELENTDKEFYQAATTLTLGFIEESGLHIIHVGDSRLYLKNEHKLIKYTKDHTQHQKLLDAGLYTERQLKKMPGKNILTTALSTRINLEYQYIFLSSEDIVDENKELVVNIMSDGAYDFWEKRPKFSINTMNNPMAFSASLQKRIEKSGPIDDYSLVSAKFRIFK
ncbi:phosphoprotein phosphatase [Acinetobacter sp. WC-323]|uniref:PP2C family protein-serine/threonine phosphatase n=1 Tax=Acinetobacter sp. WC-323 TaxID=903918 RepID=UPI00029E6F97|nr:protein phosphatase 2C domain-containing protein [Acinetobacter sp. WC-323]EKU50904.1 phosphoprotein phosphatase [Acinetobacter sp. WC-323]